MIKNLYIIIILCFGGALVAQPTMNQLIKKADASVESGNSYGAMVYYSQALKRKANNPELLYKYGNAALAQNSFTKSEMAFSKLVDTLGVSTYPDAIYKLALSKERLGKYDEAITYYNLYSSEYGDVDPMMTKKAKNGVKSSMWAQKQGLENDAFSVERIKSGVNTGSSEHGPALLGDDLYYASLRFGEDAGKCGYSKVIGGNSALKTAESFNTAGKFTNSPAFSPDGSKLYYSLCDYAADGKAINCDLYVADVNDGKIGAGMKLKGDVNSDAYTTTHPAVDAAGNFYFASNRPGGKGGLDIYMASIDGAGMVSGVKNVDAINTVGDDATPFINSNGDLFFSSNGRLGFGGYDVYSLIDGEVSNLGAEINTSFDDLYFILDQNNAYGYLASNRTGSMFIDEQMENCCYDLYKVTVESCEVRLIALVDDCSSDASLNGATLTVTNNATGEVVYSDTMDKSNKFKPTFDCEDAYTVTASKDGYVSSSVNVGPYSGKNGNQKVKETLCLTPATLCVSLFDAGCTEPTSGSLTLYNVTDGTQETKTADNDACFDLMSDKEYKLVTTKSGFVSETKVFNTNNLNSQLTEKICFRKPVVRCSQQLPVRLYFDNDYPNPRTRSTTTDLAYSDLYNQYYAKKAEYSRKYGQRYGGKVKESIVGAVDSFFDNEVAGGFNGLNSFLSCLLKELQSGESANLFVRGYASPLAKDDYNQALTQRRVESVKNEIRRWNGGVLAKYIDNGQLKITERSFGETQSLDNVSDSSTDRKRSVYSPEASRERRVEIDEIKFNN